MQCSTKKGVINLRLTEKTVSSYNNFDKLSNDIISLAREIMPDKVIYINFLNEEVQVTMKVSNNDTEVKINQGETIDVENAICNNIDYSNLEPLVLENAKINDLSENVNNTIKNGNVGSYLGIPIVFSNGKRFGALCAAHHKHTKFDSNDIKLLQKIANLFAYYLELENSAYTDDLTKLNNAKYLLLNQHQLIEGGGLVIMLDLDNFKLVNDTLGHLRGDMVLSEAGAKLREFSNNYKKTFVVRLGGDEFIIFIKNNYKELKIDLMLETLNASFRNWETEIKDIKLTASIGALAFDKYYDKDYSLLYNEVDKLLYEAKRNKKNTYQFKYLSEQKL